jgi:hypothetical protein
LVAHVADYVLDVMQPPGSRPAKGYSR